MMLCWYCALSSQPLTSPALMPLSLVASATKAAFFSADRTGEPAAVVVPPKWLAVGVAAVGVGEAVGAEAAGAASCLTGCAQAPSREARRRKLSRFCIQESRRRMPANVARTHKLLV